jgi:hypothetical protein
MMALFHLKEHYQKNSIIAKGKFSSPQNADTILELAKFILRQGEERFLNERLEQRVLDR